MAAARSKKSWLGIFILVVIVGVAFTDLSIRGSAWLQRQLAIQRSLGTAATVDRLLHRQVPLAPCKLPGPPRTSGPWTFTLGLANAKRLAGKDDPQLERWSDIAGNHYSQDFCTRFRYTDLSPSGPEVWVHLENNTNTVRGRLEAHRLKPNFAYQMKLLGDWHDVPAAEAIGYTGRWRLPGGGTNFTDWDYQQRTSHEGVEAYILFDFFVTDANGDAVRDFALDSSLHVLWNVTRQRDEADLAAAVKVAVDAGSAASYDRPKSATTDEYITAEREHVRYPHGEAVTRLPVGGYDAIFTLTEESFHSIGNDDGYWATVYSLPVRFNITP